MTGIEYAQVDMMAYVQQKYQKAVWGAVEHILRNHIDNPIMGELTREKIKAAGIRSVFFLKEPPNLEFEQCDEKEVSYKLTSNLIGVAQGHWMISYDGTRRPLTDKEEKYLAAQEQQAYNDVKDIINTLEVKEKDLELTWEDLATIEKLGDDFIKHNQTPMSDEEFYKEVLKRFKAQKGEEV